MTKPTRPASTQLAPAPVLAPEMKAKITTWLQLCEWMAGAKKQEIELRKELASTLVPNAKEGTNVIDGQGFRVVMVRRVNRKLDKTTLDAIMEQMPQDSRVIGTLIRYEPAFSLEHYRNLSPEARKIFEQTLSIEDGSPELEIVLAEDAPNPQSPSAGIPGTGTHNQPAKPSEAELPQETKEVLAKNPTKALKPLKKPAHKPISKPSKSPFASKKPKRGKR